MSTVPPPLDTRTLPELLAQLGAAARTALPAWTPPPEGDAGTALHRIFARYVEIALQRLNGVPDKTLLAFLDLMGVSPLPPAPARAALVFGLAPGSPPTLLPAGSRASAPASGGRPEVVFETEQDLLVLPARLVAARTEDPVWDRASDHAGLLATPAAAASPAAPAAAAPGPPAGPGTPAGRSAFVGESPVPHVLHVGAADVLAADREVAVSLGFGYRSAAPDAEVLAFLQSLVLSADIGGRTREFPHATVPTEGGTVYFSLALPPADPRVVAGVGLPAAVTAHWLRLSLPAPRPDAEVPADLVLRPIALDVEGLAPPDALLSGTAPLDPSTDFLPFGERPQPGGTFLIRSDRAFAQPLTVSLLIKVGEPPGAAGAGLSLAWEYLGATGWSTVDTVVSEPKSAGALSGDGAISLTLPAVPVREVAGQAGRWVRARILSGGYGSPAEYVPIDPANPARGFQLKPGTGNLAPPRLRSLRLSYVSRTVPRCVVQAGTYYAEPAAGTEFAPFPAAGELPAAHADPDPALYLGFDGLGPQQPLSLYIDVPAPAFGRPGLPAPPALPAPPTPPDRSGIVAAARAVAVAGPVGSGAADARLRWEYYDGRRWRELTVFDSTAGCTVSGTVALITPPDLAPLTRFEPVERVWLRVRSPATDPVGSPRIAALHVNAVPAVAAVTVADEILGSSSNQPEQAFRTVRQPVQPGQRLLVAEPEPLPRDEADALAAEEGPDAVLARPDPAGGADRIWVRWHEVPNLAGSGPASRHYTVDRLTGTVRFGDGQRGMIPPRGTANVVMTYRCGGGAHGNLGPAAVVQLGTPVPGLATVTNPVPADGGADAESLAAVRERGAQVLRHRGRAVAAGDVAWLARQAAGTRVARAVCLPNVDATLAPSPGWLTVLVVPAGPGPAPRPTPGLVGEVAGYLAERCGVPLTGPGPGRINVVGPDYVQVAVDADVVPRHLAEADLVTARMVAALDAFLHPVTGGPDGTGWPLGRPVYGSEVAQVLERVPGVSHVKALALRPNQVQRRLRLTGPAAPLAPVRLPAGAAVRTADGLRSGLLAQPVPAGTLLERIDVLGFREGDRITVALDLQLLADPVAGRPPVVAVTGGRLATGFPRGSVVVSAGGRYRTRLRRGIRPAPDVPPPGSGPLLDLAEPPPLAAGDRLTVLYPFATAVATVTADTAGTVALAVAPLAAATGLPAGTLVTTVDNLVRAPVPADLPAGPDGRLARLVLSDFTTGHTVHIGPPGAGPLFTATAESVTPVSDHVHLDPCVFGYPAGHRIRIAAS